MRQVLAEHLVAEFGHIYPEWNLATAIGELSEDSGHGLPLHLAAIDNDQILAVASIIADVEVSG